MQNDGDLMEFERIKQKVFIDKEQGWVIMEQTNSQNKHGDMFVLLEWTEPKLKKGD